MLPPNVAPLQIIFIPCGIVASMSKKEKERLILTSASLVTKLKENNFRVRGDFRDSRTPGWKFNHWELKGVPIRIEFGPRELERRELTLVRRDNFQRIVIKNDDMAAVTSTLKKIQDDMFTK